MTDYETQLRDEIYKDALRQMLEDVRANGQVPGSLQVAIGLSLAFANKAMQARKESKQ